MDSDAAVFGADKARMGLDACYQDEASTNDLRRKSVQADLDTKARLDAARQEYLAAGDDPAAIAGRTEAGRIRNQGRPKRRRHMGFNRRRWWRE